MPRPKKPRIIRFIPKVVYFVPSGIPVRLIEEIILLSDEVEALKLYELDHMNQRDACLEMQVSQPTFARILDRAQRKLAESVVYGKAIRISV